MPNQNKRIKCTVCEKWMRTDELSLLSQSDEQIEKELKLRNEIQVSKEAKRLKVVEIAQNLGLPIPDEAW